MNCPHCQKELPPDYSASWCPYCGTDLATPKIEPSKEQSPLVKINWLNFFAVLFAPALLTILVALFQSSSATVVCIMCSSPVAGIIAGVILSRLNARNAGLRMLLVLIYAFVFSIFCLFSCFFGCARAGGGGVRIGG